MTIDRTMGKSTPTNFKLIFPKFPNVDEQGEKELTLNIFETVIPSLTLETVDMNWQGSRYSLPSGKINFNPWTINFVVDSDFRNWMMLMRWITFINNNYDSVVQLPKTHMVDAVLSINDNWDNEILHVSFDNVWINEIGEVRFSYREGGTDLVSQATFAYSRYYIERDIKNNKNY